MLKKLGETLSLGDTIQIDDNLYECIPEIETGTCLCCAREDKNLSCSAINCINNDIILKSILKESKINYKIVLVPQESIEILGLKLLIKTSNRGCSNCVLDTLDNILCSKIDCITNNCIISNEVIK